MAIVAVRIEMPPQGELELKGGGESPTDEQMEEESRIRQEFIDFVSPKLMEAIESPPHRSGNVSHVELLGTDVWSEMNHYLLLVTVDIGRPRIDFDSLVPPGGKVTVIGSYSSLQQWPEEQSAL